MITSRKKKPMNQIMANKYNGILNILGIRKKKEKGKEKKKKERGGTKWKNRIISNILRYNGIKIFRKDWTKLELAAITAATGEFILS